ncbi:MAG TPA: toll/interleukin-1 receptor domain-containing protein [Sphingomicrobium sp.]|nr:toll/interleukin-1 receptor domain-containing protein [Sphingomicrobium sp.]
MKRGAALADVFVSYKAEDRRRVKPLADALEIDGLSVWWDAQIGGGAAWWHTIQQQLDLGQMRLCRVEQAIGQSGR